MGKLKIKQLQSTIAEAERHQQCSITGKGNCFCKAPSLRLYLFLR